MKSIDLNCDVGESFGAYKLGNDAALLQHVTSANIACGFHAGDPGIMEQTVSLAVKNGVAIGAHPGLPDLQGFGRRNMSITPSEAYGITLYQIGALAGFVKAAGATLHHVKPHGALYNMASEDAGLSDAIAKAVFDFNPSLVLYALAGSSLEERGKSIGLRVAAEAFADRTYGSNGLLTPRNNPNALIKDVAQSLAQILSIVNDKRILSVDNKEVHLHADTICIHGDAGGAADFAKAIRKGLEGANILVKPIEF